MSYELKLDRKDRAGSRFVGSVHRAMVAMALESREEQRITQQQIADKLGVNRSIVNRILRGGANVTVRTIGEIAWALGYEAVLTFRRRKPRRAGVNIGGNEAIATVSTSQAKPRSAASANVVGTERSDGVPMTSALEPAL